MRKPLISRLLFCLFSFFLLGLISCSSTKKIKYFQDIPDSGQVKILPKAPYTPLVIQPGDIINVNIGVDDPLSAAGIINTGNNVAGGSSSAMGGASGAAGASQLLASLAGGNSTQQPLSGYQVDSGGNIDMLIIGKVMAAGNTTAQLKDKITTMALKYFKQPVVVVKFANFKVDVTGEVLRPGLYIMPDEKESIMDAISMAGDLTIFAKRENVLLIRENPDGTKSSYRLNFKKSEVLSSPLYYLRQNDILYVEPRRAKSDANDASQAKYYSLGAAVLSVLIIYATRAK